MHVFEIEQAISAAKKNEKTKKKLLWVLVKNQLRITDETKITVSEFDEMNLQQGHSEF